MSTNNEGVPPNVQAAGRTGGRAARRAAGDQLRGRAAGWAVRAGGRKGGWRGAAGGEQAWPGGWSCMCAGRRPSGGAVGRTRVAGGRGGGGGGDRTIPAHTLLAAAPDPPFATADRTAYSDASALAR